MKDKHIQVSGHTDDLPISPRLVDRFHELGALGGARHHGGALPRGARRGARPPARRGGALAVRSDLHREDREGARAEPTHRGPAHAADRSGPGEGGGEPRRRRSRQATPAGTARKRRAGVRDCAERRALEPVDRSTGVAGRRIRSRIPELPWRRVRPRHRHGFEFPGRSAVRGFDHRRVDSWTAGTAGSSWAVSAHLPGVRVDPAGRGALAGGSFLRVRQGFARSYASRG